MILADISTGNTGFADVMFLVAMILALLAAIGALGVEELGKRSSALLALAVAALSLGWLVL